MILTDAYFHQNCSFMIYWTYLNSMVFPRRRTRISLMATLLIEVPFLWKSFSHYLHLSACPHQVKPFHLIGYLILSGFSYPLCRLGPFSWLCYSWVSPFLCRDTYEVELPTKKKKRIKKKKPKRKGRAREIAPDWVLMKTSIKMSAQVLFVHHVPYWLVYLADIIDPLYCILKL